MLQCDTCAYMPAGNATGGRNYRDTDGVLKQKARLVITRAGLSLG